MKRKSKSYHDFDSKGVQKVGLVKKEVVKDCLHPHLKFDLDGGAIICIDCDRAWKPVTKAGAVDYLYGNLKNSGQTRHTPYEAPRFTKIR